MIAPWGSIACVVDHFYHFGDSSFGVADATWTTSPLTKVSIEAKAAAQSYS